MEGIQCVNRFLGSNTIIKAFAGSAKDQIKENKLSFLHVKQFAECIKNTLSCIDVDHSLSLEEFLYVKDEISQLNEKANNILYNIPHSKEFMNSLNYLISAVEAGVKDNKENDNKENEDIDSNHYCSEDELHKPKDTEEYDELNFCR